MLYTIKQKNFDLLKIILELKPNILSEYISDDLGVKLSKVSIIIKFELNLYLNFFKIDYPIYFAALKEKINEDCLKLLTPEINEKNKEFNIANLYYKGMSVLRYAIEVDYDPAALFNILSDKYCSKELLTIRDPVSFILAIYG
jgi:hypothetical protein